MAKERAEYGDEVSVGGEKGFVKGSVGVPGGREVTVLVTDEDSEGRAPGVMESAKYSVANANGEEEVRKLNEERWAEAAKNNEAADKVQEKVEAADDSAEAQSIKDNAKPNEVPATRTQSGKASAQQANSNK